MVDLLPGVYRDSDAGVAGDVLVGTMETVIPSLDGLRQKIRRFDELRNPLEVQSEATVIVPLAILKVSSNDDGTSDVYLSEGVDNDKFDKLRIGYVLVDALIRRFEVVALNLSTRASEVTDPPVDPATGLTTGSHIVVNSLALADREVFPFVSGTPVANENPTPVPADDGATKGPYIFTVATPPVAANRTFLRWSEGSVAKEGFFTINFEPGGDLGVGSTLDPDTGVVVLQTQGGTIIDADTIRIDYTTDLFPANPEDSEVRSQNLLAFLAADYAIALERSDPDSLQRSWVNSAFNLWDLKGTDDGYQFLAKIAGFTVSVDALYRVAESYSVTLPTSNISELPGGSGKFYTDLDPNRPRLDDLPLDDLPLDSFCADWDLSFPSVVQAVTVIGVTNIGFFGSEERYEVVVSTASMKDSYGTSALITDINGKVFEVLEYERIDSLSYQIIVQNLAEPGLGAATVVWSVYKRDLVLMGLGLDIEDLGTQALGFTGSRYRMTVSLSTEGPIEPGVWAFIDNDGVVFVVEESEELSPTVYQIEVIGDSPPVAGDARLFYICDLITSCDYCRASAIQFHISLGEIINHPESLADNPVDRVINRMNQMIPRHVRVSSFIFSPGPALAEWGAIAAGGTVTESYPVQALYSAYYDEDEFPADEIVVDSAPIVATSEVTITNQNVLEEYIGGSDPIVDGSWTAAGLWHVTEYRSSTQFRSFNYGQNDVGRIGDGGAVPPDYDGIAATTISRLVSPSFGLLAADSAVIVRFRHYGDVDGTAGEDLVRVEVIRDTGAVLTHTITKAMLGLASGTNGSITTYSEDIESLIGADDTYHLEFVFDTGASPTGAGTGEGWYVDDIEVQVIP
jgi:hypothetical protein